MPGKGIRVTSDGTATGTKVFTSDGVDITAELRIVSIRFVHTVKEIPTCGLLCIPSEVDVTCVGDAVQKVAAFGQ